MSIERMQKAIEAFFVRGFARFRSWFEGCEAIRFDAVIKRDAEAGKLDALATEAIAHHRTGQSRDL
jgi:hypothetical protein